MDRKLRTIIALCLVLGIVLLLPACGADEGQGRQDLSQSRSDQAIVPESSVVAAADKPIEYVLDSAHIYPLPAGCSVRHAARVGSRLLVTGYDSGVPTAATIDYQIAADGSVSFSQPVPLPLDTGSVYCQSLKAAAAGADGCFYLLTGEHAPLYMYKDGLRTNDEYQGRLELLKLSASGELLDSMKIDGWHSDESFSLAVDAQGRIYVMGSSYVSSFTWGSQDVQTMHSDSAMMCSLELTAQGVVLCNMEQHTYRYYLLDGAQIARELSFADPGDAPTLSVGNMTMCQGLDGEYLVSANSRFVECSLETGEARELYQWDFTSYPGGAEYVVRLGERAFACTVGEDLLLCVSQVAREKTERSVVQIAAYDMGISNVGGIVSQLNKSQSQYEYRINEYSAGEGSRLIADISAGGKVDLVIHKDLLDVKSDMFMDLYPYIDRDLGRDSFIPNILSALSDSGELHEIWEGVSIVTIAARREDAEGMKDISPQDWEQLVAENEQYEAVFQSFMDKDNYLKWLAQVGQVRYVDRQNAACSFDSEGFAQLMAWGKSMGDAVAEGSDGPALDISQAALSVETISDPVRLMAIRTNFGEDFSFVGFPTGEEGLSYYEPYYNGSMAIPANSSNAEGAWAYIRSLLSPEHQNSLDYSLPVELSAFSRKAEKSLEPELAEKLLDLAGDTTAAKRCSDQQISDIIIKAGQAYLFGDKTLQETVDDIQSRALIYMAEQYG